MTRYGKRWSEMTQADFYEADVRAFERDEGRWQREQERGERLREDYPQDFECVGDGSPTCTCETSCGPALDEWLEVREQERVLEGIDEADAA